MRVGNGHFQEFLRMRQRLGTKRHQSSLGGHELDIWLT